MYFCFIYFSEVSPALSIENTHSAFSGFLTFSASIDLGETVTCCCPERVFFYKSSPLQMRGLDVVSIDHASGACADTCHLGGGVTGRGGAGAGAG